MTIKQGEILDIQISWMLKHRESNYKSISEPTHIIEYHSKLLNPDFRVRVWPFSKVVPEP